MQCYISEYMSLSGSPSPAFVTAVNMELIVLLAALLVAAVALQAHLRRRRYRLPPGPKGLPILGNKYDIPEKYEWLAYERWSREFGGFS